MNKISKRMLICLAFLVMIIGIFYTHNVFAATTRSLMVMTQTGDMSQGYVTLDDSGASFSQSRVFTEEPATAVIEAFPETGYHFVEWQIKTDYTGEPFLLSTNKRCTVDMGTYDVLYYFAVFEQNQEYTITLYTSVEGTHIHSRPKTTNGGQYTLIDYPFQSPTGTTFKAWAVGSPTGPQKQPGETITVTEDTGLYPIFEEIAQEKIITVYYDINGGVPGTEANPKNTYTTTSDSITIPVSEPPASYCTNPAGKEFDGWEVEGTTYAKGSDCTISHDVEVKILWKTVSETEPETEEVVFKVVFYDGMIINEETYTLAQSYAFNSILRERGLIKYTSENRVEYVYNASDKLLLTCTGSDSTIHIPEGVTQADNIEYTLTESEKDTFEALYGIRPSKIVMQVGEAAVQTEYTIESGANQTYTIGSGTDIIIKASGNLSALTGILVDGTTLNDSQVTKESGSTIATIKSAYLDTLAVGSHTVKFEYNDGSCETTLTIAKANTNNNTTPTPSGGESQPATAQPVEAVSNTPKTGDDINMWITLLAVSAFGIITTITIVKKDK